MSALQELFVVLEKRGEVWTANQHTNGSAGGGLWFPVYVGEEAAQEYVRQVSERRPTFQAFPLNSAEAFQAIHGTPGIDYLAGRVPVDQDRFRLAAEPLMRYMAHTHHPHTKVIVDSTSAELLEGLCVHRTEKFLVD